MTTTMVIEAYPWQIHRALPKKSVRQQRVARRAIARGIDVEALERALAELTGVHHAWLRWELVQESPPSFNEPSIALRSAGSALRLRFALQPSLASFLVHKLLGEPLPLEDPRLPLDERSLGVLTALLAELAARSATGNAWRLDDPASPWQPDLTFELSIGLDDRAFAAQAWLQCSPELGSEPACSELAELDLELSLAVCAGWCLADVRLVEELELGDVLLAGSGFWPAAGEAGLRGRAALTVPDQDWGLAVELGERGIVYRGGAVSLALEKPSAAVSTSSPPPPESPATPQVDLHELVLSAPVVIRIELASVSLQAREWAELQPGDVLETHQPLGSPIILRIAGKEIGQGQLVTVDGEIGVRITQLQR